MTRDEDVAMAARMSRRASRMRVANTVMRRVLNLPFRTPISEKLMLLFYRGRRTGRAYRQPVSYVRDGDVLLTPGGGRWKENLRDDEPISARVAGRMQRVRPEFVRDPSEVERLLLLMMVKNTRLTSFVPFIGGDGQLDRAGLQLALDHGFCVVRWRIEGGRS